MREMSNTLRFGLKFVAGFCLLMGAFEASRGSAFERFLVEEMILAPTVRLIDAIAPGEHVELVGRTLSSPGSNLRITRGCEGIELFLMLTAGILAYPAAWRRRAQGFLIGGALAYLLSVSRLIALHFILRYSPSAWAALHGLVLPLGPVLAIAAYFVWWSAPALRHAGDAQPAHAV